jgi:hypothetical protein
MRDPPRRALRLRYQLPRVPHVQTPFVPPTRDINIVAHLVTSLHAREVVADTQRLLYLCATNIYEHTQNARATISLPATEITGGHSQLPLTYPAFLEKSVARFEQFSTILAHRSKDTR